MINYIVSLANCIEPSWHFPFFGEELSSGSVEFINISRLDELKAAAQRIAAHRMRMNDNHGRVILCIPRTVKRSQQHDETQTDLYYRTKAYRLLLQALCTGEYQFSVLIAVLECSLDSIPDFEKCNKELSSSFIMENGTIFPFRLSADTISTIADKDVCQYYIDSLNRAQSELEKTPPEHHEGVIRTALQENRSVLTLPSLISCSPQYDQTTTPLNATQHKLLFVHFLKMCISESDISQQAYQDILRNNKRIFASYSAALAVYCQKLEQVASAPRPQPLNLKNTVVSVDFESSLCAKQEHSDISKTASSFISSINQKNSFSKLPAIWGKSFMELRKKIMLMRQNAQQCAQRDAEKFYSALNDSNGIPSSNYDEQIAPADIDKKRNSLIYDNEQLMAELISYQTQRSSDSRRSSINDIEKKNIPMVKLLACISQWNTRSLLIASGTLTGIFFILYLCSQGYLLRSSDTAYIFAAFAVLTALIALICIPLTKKFIASRIRQQAQDIFSRIESCAKEVNDHADRFSSHAKTVAGMSQITSQLEQIDDFTTSQQTLRSKYTAHADFAHDLLKKLECIRSEICEYNDDEPFDGFESGMHPAILSNNEPDYSSSPMTCDFYKLNLIEGGQAQ